MGMGDAIAIEDRRGWLRSLLPCWPCAWRASVARSSCTSPTIACSIPRPRRRRRASAGPVRSRSRRSENDADSNYRKNWRQSLNSLPSFQQALELPENNGLGIEPYYIRFVDQNRSIVDDAREIDEAVDPILQRHDPGFVRRTPTAYTSASRDRRLQQRHDQHPALPEEPARIGTGDSGVAEDRFHPVSEFVALSPPNHGIGSRVSAPHEHRGPAAVERARRDDLLLLPAAEAHDFIERLNGHPIADTTSLDAAIASRAKPPEVASTAIRRLQEPCT